MRTYKINLSLTIKTILNSISNDHKGPFQSIWSNSTLEEMIATESLNATIGWRMY